MKYAKITNGIVAQIQPNKQDGFVVVEDNVVCGMIDNGDGTFSNPTLTPEELEAKAIAHFKSLYLDLFNTKLKELGYDSIATVTTWLNDVDYGVEATRIDEWRKALVKKNIAILNDAKSSGVIPTDEEYLTEIAKVVF